METTEEVRFIDQGSNFEGVYCPACSADLDQWWKEAMDRAWQTRFANLAAVVPCCGSATSLNDLRYVWPAGFARFVLEAKNPGITDLAHHDLAQLETTLGCRLRRIWAHY